MNKERKKLALELYQKANAWLAPTASPVDRVRDELVNQAPSLIRELIEENERLHRLLDHPEVCDVLVAKAGGNLKRQAAAWKVTALAFKCAYECDDEDAADGHEEFAHEKLIIARELEKEAKNNADK